MSTKVTRYCTGERIEVAFVQKDGKLVLAAVDKGNVAFSWAELWAAVTPSGLEPGDYTIGDVYMGNPHSWEEEILTGELREAAVAILKADDQWRVWAQDEVYEAAA